MGVNKVEVVTNVKLERRSSATPGWVAPATPVNKDMHSPDLRDKERPHKEKVCLYHIT